MTESVTQRFSFLFLLLWCASISSRPLLIERLTYNWSRSLARTRYVTFSVISPTELFFFFFSFFFKFYWTRSTRYMAVRNTGRPLHSMPPFACHDRCFCTIFVFALFVLSFWYALIVCVTLSLSFAWQVEIRYRRPDGTGRRPSVGSPSPLSSLDTSLTLQIHSDYQVSISIMSCGADITIKMYTDD